jgi:hypothetical protein
MYADLEINRRKDGKMPKLYAGHAVYIQYLYNDNVHCTCMHFARVLHVCTKYEHFLILHLIQDVVTFSKGWSSNANESKNCSY